MGTTSPQIAPYGSWPSPISTDLIVGDTVGLSQPTLDGDDSYWLESRPAEGGRTVLVRRTPDGACSDVTEPPFNVRSRVHEYGGGAFAVAGGLVVFSHFLDNRLYRLDLSAGETEPRPITPDCPWRYADLVLDRGRDRLICVREDHSDPGEPINTLVDLPLDGATAPRVLTGDADFLSSPCLSPDGSRFAWLTWNHPDMPWDQTRLWVANVKPDGSLDNAETLLANPSESLFQPTWAPDGALHITSDRTGWWNLYRIDAGGSINPLCPREAEFGLPQWVFGLSTYGFTAPDQIVYLFTRDGVWHLGRLDTAAGRLTEVETPYTDLGGLRVDGDRVVFVGASPTRTAEVVHLSLRSGELTTLRRASDVTLDPGYLSVPEAISFPTTGGETAHAFFYPPTNRDARAPDGERPPLIVQSHGGPTSATATSLSLAIQYWTSRGFGVLDVNYGGSTGYGRPYRERLYGRWGIVDVDDCLNSARFLVERGDADPDRLIIRGGSASGYTTLAALTFHDLFRAGTSFYGISDLETMAADTHKFESRYLDRLIGPYPEQRQMWRERSPIHYVDQLNCPLLLFQGLDDKVVPPDQAELMASAVRAKGLPVALMTYEGEGHGFRQAVTIKRTLDAQLFFYGQVLGFEPADVIEPVAIANLDGH